MNFKGRRHFRLRGFTMIEVLVTLVILSVGLLGLAGLQLRAVRNTHNSYLRSQATFLAYDMADRIRANRNAALAGKYNGIDTATKSYADKGCSTTSSATGSACSATDMAAQDAYEWKQTLQNNKTGLPDGAGTVTNNGDGTFTVAVSWTERVRAQESSSGSETKTYSMVFRP